jgi:hypothetical protein
MAYLVFMCKENPLSIMEKAGIDRREFASFSCFVEMVLFNSGTSRYKLMAFTIKYRLSWGIIGEFYREYTRRLEDGRRLYPCFGMGYYHPWRLDYTEYPNEYGETGDSSFVCTVEHRVIPDDDIVGNFKPPNRSCLQLFSMPGFHRYEKIPCQ